MFALVACSPAVRPALTKADLQRIMVTSALGRTPSEAELVLPATPHPDFCIDLNRPGRTFADNARRLTELDRWKLRLRLGLNPLEWEDIQSPLETGPAKKVDASLNARLNRAEADALLSLSSDAPDVRAPDWPESCDIKSWFQQPVYVGDFAFIESGSVCGELCGQGTILALEYRNGHWQLIAQRVSWMA
jgi:hypothetical protein